MDHAHCTSTGVRSTSWRDARPADRGPHRMRLERFQDDFVELFTKGLNLSTLFFLGSFSVVGGTPINSCGCSVARQHVNPRVLPACAFSLWAEVRAESSQNRKCEEEWKEIKKNGTH